MYKSDMLEMWRVPCSRGLVGEEKIAADRSEGSSGVHCRDPPQPREGLFCMQLGCRQRTVSREVPSVPAGCRLEELPYTCEGDGLSGSQSRRARS